MLLSKPLENMGDIRGVVYDFEFAGDILPKHNHTEADAHITIVARGRLKAYSHDWEQEYSTGQVVDFPAYQPHELMALDDNTRLVNVVKQAPKLENVWPTHFPKLSPELRNAAQPDVKLVAVSNMFTRLMHFKNAGDIEHDHYHTSDHALLVSFGSIQVDKLDRDGTSIATKTVNAPNVVFIDKLCTHRFTALTDGAVCASVHSVAKKDGDIVDPDFLIEPLDVQGKGELRNAVIAKYGQDMKPTIRLAV